MNKQNKELKTTIRIVGEINIDTLRMFLDETDMIMESYKQYKTEVNMYNPVIVQPFPAITIEISSYGGCTDCGSAILHRMDEMKEKGIRVNTHANFCYSMAFIIFLNGDKRTGERYSKFMNHGSCSRNLGYIEEQKSSILFSEKSDEQFEQLIYETTNMSKERVEKARLCYDWFGYEEAIELGVINFGFEGAEIDMEEVERKFNQGIELALQTFCQIMEVEDELEGLQLLYMGLKETMNSLPQEVREGFEEMEKQMMAQLDEIEVVEEEEEVVEEKPKKKKTTKKLN
jgi:ATP-dependent protease ClpP protease subunit